MSSEEIKNLRRKLKKARDNGKLQEISDCCCNLAAYLSDEEDHEEALKLYKESLTCCEKLESKVGAALANRMIAEECTHLGYFDEALQHISLFLKYAQDECDKVEEQRGFVLKGHVYFTQAEYLIDTKPEEFKTVERLLDQSMECYRKSFAICTNELEGVNEREKLQMKARLLQNKSLVLSRQNKLDYAQAHLIRAIKICTKEKLNDTEHICYLSLGDLFLKKAETQKALHVYDKALEISHSNLKKRDSLIGKAKCYIELQDYQLAKATLKKAYYLKPDDEIKKLFKNVTSVIQLEACLDLAPDSEVCSRKDLLKKLGDVYCLLRNYKKGSECYLNMLKCAQKADVSKNNLIKCYSLLCKAFVHDKQYDKALFYSHQEIESLSKWLPEKTCKTHLRIAKLHELNGSEYEEIHFAYQNAIHKAKSVKNTKLEIKCLKRLIYIGETFNKPDLITKSETELLRLKNSESDSNCESDDDELESSDSDTTQSSDIDSNDLMSDSDAENEEYDRPKERCKRTKFTIKRNEKGETDLHVAAIKGNYKKVKQLLDQGHPVNVRDTAGWTPLHEACNHGHVDIVNVLLDFGADANDRGGPCCDGTTPLHDAAINGQLKVIECLIKRGASTLVLNDAGETPLQCLSAWKKNSALDADEDAIFETIKNSLKSPLDSEDIQQHLKPNRIKSEDSKSRKPNSDPKPCRTSPVSDYKETIEFFRGKRQYRRRTSGSSSENSEDESFRKKAKPACEEYKKAINELRFKPKKTTSFRPKSRPALINAEDYVDNCIVEDGYEEEIQSRKTEDILPRKIEEIPPRKVEERPAKKSENISPGKIEEIQQLKKEKAFELSNQTNITVKIFNEKIKIPVNQSELSKLKANWLNEEISKRHKNLTPDYFLTLKSENGPVGESESLSELSNRELECIATKYKALSLCERYQKICSVTSHPDISSEVRAFGFKHSIHPQVLEELKKSKSRSITLSNLKLSSLTLIPICKALKYENFIQNLDLSNNYFGDKGVELLVKIFEMCIIEELNVSGCNITSTGVYHFSHALSGLNELSKNGLEVLNLSNNPITDDAVTAFESIIERLPNLRRLDVNRCDLESEICVGSSNSLIVVQGSKFESPRRSDS